MNRTIYCEEHRWKAFKNSELTIGLELVKTPRGYAVHILRGGNKVQNLTREQAEAVYRQLSEKLWGYPVTIPLEAYDLEVVPTERDVRRWVNG